MSGRDDKAQRYIALLDSARANGNWSELPELIRKVTKHAPQRKCFISTATLDYEIIQGFLAGARKPTPSAAVSAPVGQSLNSVANEIKLQSSSADDAIQAQTSLLWARWASQQSSQGFEPDETVAEGQTPSNTNSIWTKICFVKAAYIRGTLLQQNGRAVQANSTYKSIIPWLNENKTLVMSTPQFLYWTQLLSAQLALGESRLSDPSIKRDPNAALQAFRQWAVLSSQSKDVPSTTYGCVGPRTSKLSTWKAYYQYLSDLLRDTGKVGKSTLSMSSLDQAAELRRVESAYESELLRSTQFPQATESNAIIEEWVEQVIRNWRTLCGPKWSEADLGEGGRNSVVRNVIDILYRATMKTFQSTLILRRLFQVHKVLADFDLAYKALDTYLELTERGRSRAAKSSEPETGQDNDEIVLSTLAEGIEGLCLFGRHAEAERAYNLSVKLEHLFDEIDPSSATVSFDGRLNGITEDTPVPTAQISPEVRSQVHRSLGIAKAQWAKWTPFSEKRSSLQANGVAHLSAAVGLPTSREQKTQASYALSLLLAETREIDQAIEQVKAALTRDASTTDNEDFLLQRELIPVWHLLALLLTSRQDFDTAAQSCVAAFEQFSSPTALFGTGPGRSRNFQKQNENLVDVGLVDDMECDELQRIVEIRITELALTELVEGPEHAVNSSNDLLALFFRLFGHLGVTAEDKPIPRLSVVPKSSAGTVKSFRGSIFGRRKLAPPSEVFSEKVNEAPSTKTATTHRTTESTQPTPAPRIQVTDEDNKPSPQKLGVFRRSHDKNRHEKTSSSQPRSKDHPHSHLHSNSHSHSHLHSSTAHHKDRPAPNASNVSSQRQSFETSQEVPRSSTDSVETAMPHLETIKSVGDMPTSETGSGSLTSAPEAKQPPTDVPYKAESNQHDPLPATHEERPLGHDVRQWMVGAESMAASPVTRLPKATAQKHALIVLTKIWLVVAKLYRRANMFDDSREATDEAAKAALKIESLIASVESSARAFADPGWASGGKSSDEVWADIYCARGELLLATATARAEKDGEIDSEGVREAVEQYEQCLMYFADHPGGIIGLSNVLLDYYERKVDLGRKVDDGRPKMKEAVKETASKDRRPALRTSDTTTSNGKAESTPHAPSTAAAAVAATDEDLKKTPENLNRLAARDRAYGLLSTLTKLGSGWDDSEAWYALARAHELGGEIEKAKEILWWCVELEDTRPIRHWRNLGCRGYVL